MAEQFKLSVNIKPRPKDELRGSGIVNFSTYMDWAVDITGAYIDKLGLVPPPNVLLTPLRDDLTYHSPLLISEEAKVSVRTTRIGRSSVVAEFQIAEAKTGRLVTTIISTGVYIDAQTRRSVPVPDEIKKKIIAFEGKENVEVAAK